MRMDVSSSFPTVSARGRKSRLFRYCWQATQHRVFLGTHPNVTLRNPSRTLLGIGAAPE